MVYNLSLVDVNMQDVKEVVNIAVAEAIHQELPKCIEEKLNANFFHSTSSAEYSF